MKRRIALLICAVALAALALTATVRTTPAEGSTLDAEEHSRYCIVYESNGGRGTVAGDVPPCGQAVALDDGGELSRKGYVFTGWNTRADGTGIAYEAGQVVSDVEDAGHTLTLYAQWRRVS